VRRRARARPLDAKAAEWAAKGFTLKERIVKPDTA